MVPLKVPDDGLLPTNLGACGQPIRSGGLRPMQKFFSLFKQEKAQTMAEYATVLTVITIFCLAGLALLAAASTGALERVAGLLT
jgi:Flp pilus assembly pilin Flp